MAGHIQVVLGDITLRVATSTDVEYVGALVAAPVGAICYKIRS